MTYYVAESTRRPSDKNRYICINEDMKYSWFPSISAINPADLTNTDDHTPTMTIHEWLAILPKYNMRFVFSFTEQSHPELFI